MKSQMPMRYKHNLSHFRNTTAQLGELTPIAVYDVIQGDTVKAHANIFMRTSPLVAPVMHPVHSRQHNIFFPYRILFDDWTDFITGGEDLTDASQLPYIDFSGRPVEKGSLAHHLGIPEGCEDIILAFEFTAYYMYWNEYVRDDQLQDKYPISTSGGDVSSAYPDVHKKGYLQHANWDKDYFTSARPDDILGSDVTIPLGDTAPVTGLWGDSVTTTSALNEDGSTATGNFRGIKMERDGTGFVNPSVDLSAAQGATLQDLRLAIATSRFQEIINVAGNTYEDYLRRHGIKYSDARLQRPEYLSGGKSILQFSEVIQTAEGDDPVGTLRGHGMGALRSNKFIKFFEEAGVVMSLFSAKPIPMYMQGVPRRFSRKTRTDFYQKEFEILGMQEIKNREIKFDHSSPDDTFGYGERFYEYRKIPNTVHGDFVDFYKPWHFAQEYAGDVALNSTLITCDPTNRPFADQTNDPLIMTVQNKAYKRSFVRNHDRNRNFTI